MSEFTVGEFTLKVYGPYPVWVSISTKEGHLVTVRHDSLCDLDYAIKRAKRDARLLLKEDKDEVVP